MTLSAMTLEEITYRINSNILELQQAVLDLGKRGVNREVVDRFGVIKSELSELQTDMENIYEQFLDAADAQLGAKYKPEMLLKKIRENR